jgi:hypothetical protein
MLTRCAFISLCLGATACGGAADTELFAGNGTGGSADAGPDAAGDSGGLDGTVRDGGKGDKRDAAPDDAFDANDLDAADDAVSPPDPGVWCGNTSTYCAPPDICCVVGIPSSPTYTCDQSLFDCPTGVPIACDDEADCISGDVCCGVYDQTLGYRHVTCEKSCDGLGPNGELLVRFCNPDVSPDECAQLGKHCMASPSLPGYYRCQ